ATKVGVDAEDLLDPVHRIPPARCAPTRLLARGYPLRDLHVRKRVGSARRSSWGGPDMPARRRTSAPRTGIIPNFLDKLEWRNAGPFRGGRVGAVAGDPRDRNTFYFGSTGGGVWKTGDGGLYWENMSDGFFKRASVGAIAVLRSDPNVIYAGMGESCIRGNVSHGAGAGRGAASSARRMPGTPGPTSATPAAFGRASWARAASPPRRRRAAVCSRSSRRRTARCSAPTTAATTGSAAARTETCASAP